MKWKWILATLLSAIVVWTWVLSNHQRAKTRADKPVTQSVMVATTGSN